MSSDLPKTFTQTESRLHALLTDGDWHTIEDIMRDVMGRRFGSPSLVPTHIGRLRKKLPECVRIESMPGMGYRLVAVEV